MIKGKLALCDARDSGIHFVAFAASSDTAVSIAPRSYLRPVSTEGFDPMLAGFNGSILLRAAAAKRRHELG